MATVDDQITKLEAAIASGALSVRHGETMIQYRSLAEMNAVLAQLKARRDGTTRRSVAKFRRW